MEEREMVVDTIVVFTGESIEEILEQGGSSRWRLNLKWASEHTYVVCVRNAKADWTIGTEAHRSAFLVGKICEFVPEVEPAKGNRPPQDRYLIKCSHYALIDIPDLWNKGDQYPVRYKSMTDIGIDPSEIKWRPMPQGDSSEMFEQKEPDARAEDAVASAKEVLAKVFGVAPSAIEITIKI
jgi:hypothetical protein